MEESLVKRVQPHSVEAEQMIIGSILLDNKCIPSVENIIQGEDFYHRQYGVIFDTMMELHREGSPIDLMILQNRLKEKEVPPEVCSTEYIGELISSVPISANVQAYAEIVYEKALLRRLIKTTEGIANECYAGKERVENILADTEKKVFDILNRRKTSDYVPIDQIVLKSFERINKAYQSNNPVTGISTGFIDLDYMLSGLQPSDLILLAARPSMGKTAISLNMVLDIVVKQQLCAAFFSLEMSGDQLVNRLLSMDSHVDSQNIRTGQLGTDEWTSLFQSADRIGHSKLIIDATPGISLAEMRTKCRQYKLEHDLKVIVIDYLQLMTGSGKSGDNRQQEISEISRGLKALAREMEVPVIALSQLSRAVEGRADHRPMLSDLRESGAIEQDADVVMFLYRDEYYNKDSAAKGITEVIVAKQRNGAIGTVELVWLPQYTRFANKKK